ncbi:hypothetical protein P280DRAFT_431316 [Massarina eburnea CBS 473.64]|uniref:Rhodopsin domain-containing protein n=1 Tax=Massarina eburnea CBS 473.64 TaxID=1395130 RepID=A0A6A6RS61_9PLEO|nr:hypothetical protein P280DRAFT_431316 [Massarina eburnea CBS 473.64]
MERISELVAGQGVEELGWEQVQSLIEHAGRVDQLSFKVWTVILAVCAVFAATARLLIRYRRERTCFLEDYLILFATTCLICETGLMHSFIKPMYLIDAATFRLPVLSFLVRSTDSTHSRFGDVLAPLSKVLSSYITFGLLAIFAVKASFLALFYKLLRNVSAKLMAWFWATVAATGMSAFVVVLEGFMICPQFGVGPMQCFVKNGYTISVGSGVVIQSLDIVTDLMIISIPIVLLQMTQLHIQHKLRLTLVLCLSTACIVLSIVRMAGGVTLNVFARNQFSLTWVSFTIHCEAAVAVMAGSVPALHALFTSLSPTTRKRMALSVAEDEFVKEKALQVPARDGRDLSEHEEEEIGLAMPGLVHERARVVSIARWGHSIVGILPKRAGSSGGPSVEGSYPSRNNSADSGLVHPGIAYHEFRRQMGLRDRERNECAKKVIKVTHETTVSSQSASQESLDLNEVNFYKL